jgi:hypothetical protein
MSKNYYEHVLVKGKCPHGRREDPDESETVTAAACDEEGGGGEDHPKGGRGEGMCVLLAGEKNWNCDP